MIRLGEGKKNLTSRSSCFYQIQLIKGAVYERVTVFELVNLREELGPLSRNERDVIFSFIEKVLFNS